MKAGRPTAGRDRVTAEVALALSAVAAALPAAFVALGLLDGTVTARGVVTAFEALGARRLIDALAAEGYAFLRP